VCEVAHTIVGGPAPDELALQECRREVAKAQVSGTAPEDVRAEASRIITRVKAAFVRLGIRSFNPKLKTAAAHLETLRTPEGEPIPPNTLAALKRDLERHRIVKQQIREIEETRLERLAQAPSNGPHAMVRLLARVIGVGVETADMLVQEVLSRPSSKPGASNTTRRSSA
jgi:hypothetical protein